MVKISEKSEHQKHLLINTVSKIPIPDSKKEFFLGTELSREKGSTKRQRADLSGPQFPEGSYWSSFNVG